MPRHSKRAAVAVKTGFTLLELLVVIGIMAIMMGIAIPFFAGLANSSGVEYTTRNINSRIGLCRAQAILRRKYIALLLPVGSITNANYDKYNFNRYRPCIVEFDSGSNFDFVEWMSGEQWTKCSTGAIFTEDTTADLDGATFDSFPTINGVVLDTSTTVNNVKGIVFRPAGSVYGLLSHKIKIIQGVGTGSGATGYQQTDSGENVKYIFINSFTGRSYMSDENRKTTESL